MNPYDTEYELLLSIKVFMIIFRVRLNTIAFLFVDTENNVNKSSAIGFIWEKNWLESVVLQKLKWVFDFFLHRNWPDPLEKQRFYELYARNDVRPNRFDEVWFGRVLS